ncbi:MAG: transcription termination/antitermination protein NusG [Terriglobales bacterium]
MAAHWYAVYTRARHEKRVASQLEQKRIEFFLPLYESMRRWKDRRVLLPMPLFPGYIFVHFAVHDRLQVLTIPGVVRLVSFDGRPAPMSERDVEALRQGLSEGLRAEPHPYLKVGRRVRVRSGPLAGMEGILTRKKDRFRLVLSLDLIMRSVAVEVDAADVEPIS